jgi:hypothetical protein
MSESLAIALSHARLVADQSSGQKPLYIHSAKVYSQNGEDGMVAEIFRRIDYKNKFFVEIGIGDGLENNTRLLLETGWHGVWIEGDQVAAARAAGTFATHVGQGALAIVSTTVAPDSINAILDEAQVPQEVDFLSVDIDQHTSHVWRSINRRSRVACIEYNASIPAAYAIEVPYDSSQTWDGTNWFGAGLKSIELIGRAKGLALVGCDLAGVNAFLVADEAADRFSGPFTAEAKWEPPRYELGGQFGHPPSRVAREWTSSAEQLTQS